MTPANALEAVLDARERYIADHRDPAVVARYIDALETMLGVMPSAPEIIAERTRS